MLKHFTEIKLRRPALMDQNDVKYAEISSNSPPFSPQIRIIFTKNGAEHTGKVTLDNIGKRLAIVIAGKIYSAPQIHTQMTREATIAGSFNLQEAKELVAEINKSLRE